MKCSLMCQVVLGDLPCSVHKDDKSAYYPSVISGDYFAT